MTKFKRVLTTYFKRRITIVIIIHKTMMMPNSQNLIPTLQNFVQNTFNIFLGEIYIFKKRV